MAFPGSFDESREQGAMKAQCNSTPGAVKLSVYGRESLRISHPFGYSRSSKNSSICAIVYTRDWVRASTSFGFQNSGDGSSQASDGLVICSARITLPLSANAPRSSPIAYTFKAFTLPAQAPASEMTRFMYFAFHWASYGAPTIDLSRTYPFETSALAMLTKYAPTDACDGSIHSTVSD
uniref:Uncharacterized protein n=1 Tax=Anopheles coluzzii TaxID=1518534 RepID=A0A8W7PZ13_ANOCL